MEFEEPIRAELFSSEGLKQSAENLAGPQRIATMLRKGRRRCCRVLDSGRVLLETYRAIAQTIREEPAIEPAAEWLGFHLAQIRRKDDEQTNTCFQSDLQYSSDGS